MYSAQTQSINDYFWSTLQAIKG
uniref:Uncharacterized protein n=1 Tax=Anguilla anguilla TaxID=7936 RepID=A0A0E9XVV1_ANGAN